MATSLKRNLEGEDADAQENKKIRADGGAEVSGDATGIYETRVLIDNFEASVIIGKGGANVKQIRIDSGAFVSILKNESSVSKERVMTIKVKHFLCLTCGLSTHPCDPQAPRKTAFITSVWKCYFYTILQATPAKIAVAIKLITELLLSEANRRKAESSVPGEQDTTYAIKVLIHKFLAGSIIGKAGAIIKEMQEMTGCRVQLSNEPLTGSTEKTVTLTGTPDCIHDAASRVMEQLNTNPLREGCTSTPYVPGAVAQAAASPYGLPPGVPPPFSPYGGSAPSPYSPYATHSHYGHSAPGAPSGAIASIAGSAGVTKVEKIVIPTVTAGNSHKSVLRNILFSVFQFTVSITHEA